MSSWVSWLDLLLASVLNNDSTQSYLSLYQQMHSPSIAFFWHSICMTCAQFIYLSLIPLIIFYCPRKTFVWQGIIFEVLWPTVTINDIRPLHPSFKNLQRPYIVKSIRLQLITLSCSPKLISVRFAIVSFSTKALLKLNQFSILKITFLDSATVWKLLLPTLIWR